MSCREARKATRHHGNSYAYETTYASCMMYLETNANQVRGDNMAFVRVECQLES